REVVHQTGLGDAGGTSGGVQGQGAIGPQVGFGGVEHRLACGRTVRSAGAVSGTCSTSGVRGVRDHAVTLPTGWPSNATGTRAARAQLTLGRAPHGRGSVGPCAGRAKLSGR